MIDHYSFLLYFSHETGRIERFLYNSGAKQEMDKPTLVLNELEGHNYIDSNNNLTITKDELDNYLNNDFNPEELKKKYL